MRAKILLANSAEVREGLLYILGGTWNTIGPLPQPFAIAGVIEVNWDECNQRHTAEFAIDDVDGAPLLVQGLTGEQPFRLTTTFEVGRPPLVPQGTTFNVPIAIPLPGPPWIPGRQYVLIVRINGDEMDRARFSVRASAGAPAAPPTALPPPQP